MDVCHHGIAASLTYAVMREANQCLKPRQYPLLNNTALEIVGALAASKSRPARPIRQRYLALLLAVSTLLKCLWVQVRAQEVRRRKL
jgi:hypothetical protein